MPTSALLGALLLLLTDDIARTILAPLEPPAGVLTAALCGPLFSLIRRLASRDRLAIIVTLHDLHHAALGATRIALLAHGTLVAMGIPKAVLTPDRLGQAYDMTVVVTRQPIHHTPLVVAVLSAQDD